MRQIVDVNLVDPGDSGASTIVIGRCTAVGDSRQSLKMNSETDKYRLFKGALFMPSCQLPREIERAARDGVQR